MIFWGKRQFHSPLEARKKRFSHPILRLRELVALLLDAWPFPSSLSPLKCIVHHKCLLIFRFDFLEVFKRQDTVRSQNEEVILETSIHADHLVNERFCTRNVLGFFFGREKYKSCGNFFCWAGKRMGAAKGREIGIKSKCHAQPQERKRNGYWNGSQKSSWREGNFSQEGIMMMVCGKRNVGLQDIYLGPILHVKCGDTNLKVF